MNLFHDRQTRHYLIFLSLLCCLMPAFFSITAWQSAIHTRDLLFEREEAIASSLLTQNISPQTVAAAFDNVHVTEDGQTLLQKIGHTSSSNPWLIDVSQKSALFDFRMAIAFSLILILLLITGSLYYLIRREYLYQQADNIAAAYAVGDYLHRLPLDDGGALYHLFGTIDNLATALKAKNEVEHQMKEFLRATISDISHQLKTPLAALNLYAEIIAAEPDHPDTVAEFNRKSMQSLNRIERLILLLLKVARLDSGCVIYEKLTCPVSELVSSAVDNLLIRASEEQKELIVEGSNDVSLFCDPEWTAEALSNLIKNALDHTVSGDTIRISWEHSPAMLRIMVADTGEGIAPEDIHHIFKRFYRSSHSSDAQGIGLGLSLARLIVEGQGGLISVQSEQGRGTVFTISFLTEM